jgi:signal transduction histidine kinase
MEAVRAIDQEFAQGHKAARGILYASSEQELFSVAREYVRSVVPQAELGVYLQHSTEGELYRLDCLPGDFPATISANSEFASLLKSDIAKDHSYNYYEEQQLEGTLSLPRNFQGIAWLALVVPPNFRLLFLAAVPNGVEGDYSLHREFVLLLSSTFVLQLRHIWDTRKQSILNLLASLDSENCCRSDFFCKLASEFAEILQAEGCTILARCRDTNEKQVGVVGTTGLFYPRRGQKALTPEEIAAIRYSEGEGLTGTILKTGQPIRLDHVSDDQLANAKSAESPFTRGESRPFLGFPIVSRGEVVAIVRLHARKNPGPEGGRTTYSLVDEAVLMELSPLLSRVLERYHTSLDRRELSNHRRFLLESTEALYRSASVQDVFDAVVKSAREISDANAAYFLVPHDNNGFQVQAHAGENDIPCSFVVPKGKGLVAKAAKSGECVLVPTVSESREFWLPPELKRLPFVIRSEACVPMMASGDCIGVLSILSSLPYRFYPNCLEEPTLVALARYGAILMVAERERLEKAHLNRRLAEEIEKGATRQVGKALAHQTRGIIGRILGEVHRLRDLESQVPELKKRIDAIVRKIEEHREVYITLIERAEIELPSFERIEPRGIVRNFWQEHKKQLLRRQMRVEFAPDSRETIGKVSADPGSLLFIAHALLDNACYWGKSRVSIGLKDDGSRYVLVVTDDGPGISAENVQHVMDHTRQFTTKPPSEGTGWGLNLVQMLARQHGGKLHYLRGNGLTEFHVSFLKNPTGKELASC